MAKHRKKQQWKQKKADIMKVPAASRNPHTFLSVPYSIHPESSLARVPIVPSQMHKFSPKAAWLGKVEVDNEWWNVPPDAQRKTERFLKDVIFEPFS